MRSNPDDLWIPPALRPGMRPLAALLIVLVALPVSCARGSSEAGSRVEFRTSDGFLLEGRIFGTGARGVVLAHMRPSDQTSWFGFAEELGADGYQVLTFNFRGYGESQGERDIGVIDRDVRAALEFLVEHGASGVVVVGASMGGTAALAASVAVEDPSIPVAEVKGVVALSAPARIDGLNALRAAGAISAPKLYVAADGDGEAVADAEELFRSSAEPKTLKIVPGDAHGTDLLRGRSGTEIASLVKEFIAEAG